MPFLPPNQQRQSAEGKIYLPVNGRKKEKIKPNTIIQTGAVPTRLQ